MCHGASPSGMHGSHLPLLVVIEKYGYAIGCLHAYAQSWLAGDDGIGILWSSRLCDSEDMVGVSLSGQCQLL